MNSRLTVFDSPLFLGFDHFERTFDRLKKTATEGYPPYNIEQTGENALRITVAVAGFTMGDLDVQVENNQLTIRGQQSETRKRPKKSTSIAGSPPVSSSAASFWPTASWWTGLIWITVCCISTCAGSSRNRTPGKSRSAPRKKRLEKSPTASIQKT